MAAKNDIFCKHAKKEKEGYNYKLHEQTLWLCKQCNLELAMELMQQLAVEAFVKPLKDEE